MTDKIPLPANRTADKQHLHTSSQSADDKNRAAIGCLWSTLSSVLPHSISKLSLEANFFNIGGDSSTTIETVEKLSEAGYNISISDFLSSKTLLDLVNKMNLKRNENRYSDKAYSNKYKFDKISEKYKADIYRIVADSYYSKSIIEKNMDPPVEKHHYIQLLDALWAMYINNPISYVVKDAVTDEVIGCQLMMDIADDRPLRLKSNYDYVIEFLEYMEKPIKETTLPKGKIMYGDMHATDLKLSPQENVEISLAMAWKIEDIARENGFIGIFSINSSPITKQLARTVLNHKILKSYQLNQFVASDGIRPFKNAEDSVVVTCTFKQF